MDHRVYLGDWTSRTPHHARIEDLLTERLTLAIPRLCHNAQADLLRKQQVLGSNPSVGSTPSFPFSDPWLLATGTPRTSSRPALSRAPWVTIPCGLGHMARKNARPPSSARERHARRAGAARPAGSAVGATVRTLADDGTDDRVDVRLLGHDDECRDHAEHAVRPLDVGQDVAVEGPHAGSVRLDDGVEALARVDAQGVALECRAAEGMAIACNDLHDEPVAGE